MRRYTGCMHLQSFLRLPSSTLLRIINTRARLLCEPFLPLQKNVFARRSKYAHMQCTPTSKILIFSDRSIRHCSSAGSTIPAGKGTRLAGARARARAHTHCSDLYWKRRSMMMMNSTAAAPASSSVASLPPYFLLLEAQRGTAKRDAWLPS